ncbi:hypothetical protein [Microbacterium sp.]|uniref:hypothetical protein n=1 Tax=Microbacterium sp. TaxID=51671 RepID=UPI003C781E8E
MKVVTNWVIHYLADRLFTSLDELNDAVAVQVDEINTKTPFRGEGRSRRDWLEERERGATSTFADEKGSDFSRR